MRRPAARDGSIQATCSPCPTTCPSRATTTTRSTRCGCGPRERPTSSTSPCSTRGLPPGGGGEGALREHLQGALPQDDTPEGRELRLKQQYFFVSCSIHDIVRRYLNQSPQLRRLPRQGRDPDERHPPLPRHRRAHAGPAGPARAGLGHGLGPSPARCIAYTDHTLLPEALERWPVDLFERLLPRHLQIIYGINSRFLQAGARVRAGG